MRVAVLLLTGLAACTGTEPASVAAAPEGPPGASTTGMTGYGTRPHVRAYATSVSEGEASVSIRVSLSPRTMRPVTVDYMTADGSARDGSDYRYAKGQLTFKPGTTEEVIKIALLDDAVAEDEESFALRLHVAEHATLDSEVIFINIRDDD